MSLIFMRAILHEIEDQKNKFIVIFSAAIIILEVRICLRYPPRSVLKKCRNCILNENVYWYKILKINDDSLITVCYVNKIPKFTKSITSDVHHMNLFRKDQFSLLGYFIYQSTIRPPAPKRFDSHVTGFFHGIY